jgi:hypothetical protein
MNILVNGSCFCRGGFFGEEIGWVDIIQERLKCNIDNFSLRGAGYNYVSETTVNILKKQKYDAVVILWPQLYRVSVKTSNLETFPKKEKTSYSVINQTERATKIANVHSKSVNIIDPKMFEEDWVFNNYPTLKPKWLVSDEPWFDFLKYTDYKTVATSNLLQAYTLQQYLKSLDMPFLFYFGKRSRFALEYQREHQIFDESAVDLTNNFVNTSRSVKSWNRRLWKSGLQGQLTFSKIVYEILNPLLEHRI